MSEKRFKVCKVSGNFGEWEVEDTVEDTVVINKIMHKYLADRLCEKLNQLHEENIKQKKVLEENEKIIQSVYGELTKLRCIKKNLIRIKSEWNWIMGVIDYD